MNDNLREDLTRLRDELISRAFDGTSPKDSTLAEIVWKINSCLGRGYPQRIEVKNEYTNR